MIRFYLLFPVISLCLMSSCQSKPAADSAVEESAEAKSLLQGIWIDTETEEVTFWVKGDTIFYPDSTVQPTYFKIVGDTIHVGRNRYPVLKQTPYLFWFKNLAGDVIKLSKSDDPNDVLDFNHEQPQILTSLTDVLKADSVVAFEGIRYHWYIAINPTKYKVTTSSYGDDGVEVENVYYDNIINISVFQGSRRVFSSDFKKQMFVGQVPEGFLEQAILGNMQYNRIDKNGLHFDATICIPDGAACYLISVDVGFDGQCSMQLLES